MNNRYNRSTSYRYVFFSHNKGYGDLYFCAYCGFPHKKQKITVDHVIPIHAAQTSWILRRYLDLHRKNINDASNLVPCCKRCNRRKGSNFTPYWLIKAKFSRIPYFWVFIWAFRFVVIILLICFLR